MSRPPASPARFLSWIVAPVAALLVLFVAGVANRGPEWTVVAVVAGPPHEFLADGRPVSLAPEGGSAGLLPRAARHLSTGDSTTVRLRLSRDPRGISRSAEILLLEMAPGSRIGAPNAPGRFVDRDVELTLIEGRLRILKGAGSGTGLLRAYTPEARMEIDSRLVGLARGRALSEVHVYEGVVRVGTRAGGAPLTVRAGRSALIPGSGPPVEGPIDPGERSRLLELRNRPASPAPAGTAGGTSGG